MDMQRLKALAQEAKKAFENPDCSEPRGVQEAWELFHFVLEGKERTKEDPKLSFHEFTYSWRARVEDVIVPPRVLAYLETKKIRWTGYNGDTFSWYYNNYDESAMEGSTGGYFGNGDRFLLYAIHGFVVQNIRWMTNNYETAVDATLDNIQNLQQAMNLLESMLEDVERKKKSDD